MNKYIVIAFAFMGVWFYEASGGSDFVPGTNSLAVFAEPKPVPFQSEPRIERVARANTSAASLTDISEARGTNTLATAGAMSGLSIVRMKPDAIPEPTIEPALVETAAVVAPPAITEPAPARDPEPDYRFVEGDSVNLRGGPGTDYAVVGRLVRNDMVEVLEDEGNGWLHLRVSGTGEEGWMADWLVTAAN